MASSLPQNLSDAGSPDDNSLTRNHTLNNIRSDFSDEGLTWGGKEDRDTSLDALDVTFWASIQLYRCSERARHQGASHPTFTGAQVQERLIEIDIKIKAKNRLIAAAAEIYAMHSSRAQESEEKLKHEKRELKEYEVAREELRDLEFIAWGLPSSTT